LSLTISCRTKTAETMEEWISKFMGSGQENEVTGVFGFLEEGTPLYGGRPYVGAEITKQDIDYLSRKGIGLTIPISNLEATRKEFEDTIPMLKKYYNDNTCLLVSNDKLAKWIKEEFPLYTIEASVQRHISIPQIPEALDIYDRVPIQMNITYNLDKNFKDLEAIKDKRRIIVYATGGCMTVCENTLCHKAFSSINKSGVKADGGFRTCHISDPIQRSFILPVYVADIDRLKSMGFQHFKLVLPKDLDNCKKMQQEKRVS
jgi:hypothetical protein